MAVQLTYRLCGTKIVQLVATGVGYFGQNNAFCQADHGPVTGHYFEKPAEPVLEQKRDARVGGNYPRELDAVVHKRKSGDGREQVVVFRHVRRTTLRKKSTKQIEWMKILDPCGGKIQGLYLDWTLRQHGIRNGKSKQKYRKRDQIRPLEIAKFNDAQKLV